LSCRLPHVDAGVPLLGCWPWCQHCGPRGRLRSPTTFGKTYCYSRRYRGCRSHNGRPVRHFGRGTADCSSGRPYVSLVSFWLPTLGGIGLATYFERSTANASEVVDPGGRGLGPSI
jgi:hypothetical protein